MLIVIVLAFIFLLSLALWLYWRFKPGNQPCPTTLIPLLDNPFTHRYHHDILSRLELAPGLRILDAGCGPGLLTIPIAQAVGEKGRVLALDVQPGMLERAKARAADAGLDNIDFLQAGLGEGKLPANTFDRALLVTVLGEIPDKQAALHEIFAALKPGGFLSVTEVLPDPDYQNARNVLALATEAGFSLKEHFGNFFIFTVNLRKTEV
jgi:ubiquinone/menaquinone biosynthesis C-methylase UbiE